MVVIKSAVGVAEFLAFVREIDVDVMESLVEPRLVQVREHLHTLTTVLGVQSQQLSEEFEKVWGEGAPHLRRRGSSSVPLNKLGVVWVARRGLRPWEASS